MGVHDVVLPISALFAPCRSTQSYASEPLPSTLAIFGSIPPTTPLHLALTYLSLADVPLYDADKDTALPSSPDKDRVLVITPPKSRWAQDILLENNEWLSQHGADYSVLDKLNRVQTRSCPDLDHLLLLLRLVGVEPASRDSALLQDPPGLIVIWDMASHLMEEVDEDDDGLPDDARSETDSPAKHWRFKAGFVESFAFAL